MPANHAPCLALSTRTVVRLAPRTPGSALLAGLRVDTVLVCGATTSGCVRATAIDAVQSGFLVLVPRQCAGDRAQGPHEANLFDIQAKYGDVVELSEAIDYLRIPAEVVR